MSNGLVFDPDHGLFESFKGLQDRIDNGVDKITEITLSWEMWQLARRDESMRVVVNLLRILFPGMSVDEINQNVRERAVFYIFHLRSYPNDSLTAMANIRGLLDLDGVAKSELKKMLQVLREYLSLSDESSIVRWLKRK
jgi:hypothetical protein